VNPSWVGREARFRCRYANPELIKP
jgi:hypothetical protein